MSDTDAPKTLSQDDILLSDGLTFLANALAALDAMLKSIESLKELDPAPVETNTPGKAMHAFVDAIRKHRSLDNKLGILFVDVVAGLKASDEFYGDLITLIEVMARYQNDADVS